MSQPEAGIDAAVPVWTGRHRARRWRRRLTAASVAVLAVVDVVQAAARSSIARFGFIAVHLGGTTTRAFRYVLLLAAIALFSVLRGLLRGKRMALLVGLGGAMASLLGHHIVKADLVGITLAVGVLCMLLVNTACFRAQADPALARQAVAWLVSGLVGAYAYGLGGLYLLDAQFRHTTTLSQSASEAARLLFLLPASTIEPVTRHGTWFIESVRTVVVVVLAGGIAGLLRPVRARLRHDRDRERVGALLAANGETGLASFHLLTDKQHLFAPGGDAFIGFKVVGSVAVSLGGPVGGDAGRRAVTALFLERCELNGWLPAFHQVTDQEADALGEFGLKALKIGEEAIVDVVAFSLTGSHFKSVRSKVGKLRRDGWTVEELSHPIDGSTMHRLREVSDAWLADGGHRERTFTLGQFDEEYLQSTRVLVARDNAGIIRGFTNIVDSYRSTVGNFDLMRRDPSAHGPVMDMLFVSMIELFRAEGRTGMNLGLAPFANIDGDTLPDRALRVLYEHGSRAFNFGGLREYKDKWRPRWEPRYLVYRSDVELPAIAIGVSRAGELPRSVHGRAEMAAGWVGAAARSLYAVSRRITFTLMVAAVILFLQISTTFDTDSYPRAQRALQYNWADLFHRWQIYRVMTAIFVQDGPGMRSGIAVLVGLLGVAEYVVGSRRTVALFFVGDVVSSVAVLAVARLLAAFGSATAQRVMVERDGGTSSAIFAVLAGAVAVTRRPRLRRVCLVALCAYLLGSLVFEHRLFSIQHLVAACIGWAANGARLPAQREPVHHLQEGEREPDTDLRP